MDSRRDFSGSRPSVLRVLEAEGPTRPGRRRFLRTVAQHGASIPVVYFALSSGFGGEIGGGASASAGLPASEPRSGKISADFSRAYPDLVRRLRKAAEVEQALMLQYLYAAFSLKPAYLGVVASRAPGTVDLTSVAIQKMQHLVTVNRLLVALGIGPTLLQ